MEARHSECRIWTQGTLPVKMMRNVPLGPQTTGRADTLKFRHKNNKAKLPLAHHYGASSRNLSLAFQGHDGHRIGKDHGSEDLGLQLYFTIFQKEDAE